MRAIRFPSVLAVVALAAACSASPPAPVATPSRAPLAHHHAGLEVPAGSPVTGTVVVAADDTLARPFSLLARQFEDAYPGTTVQLEFGASAGHAQRIAAGGPADVFAASGMPAAQRVMTAGAARGDPRLFARDTLVIVVRAGSAVRRLGDLAGPRVRLALCRQTIRCGTAARQLLSSAGVRIRATAEEPDAKGALARVAGGTADAALVYRTDVPEPPPGLRILDSEDADRTADEYPIIAVATGHNPAGAQAFLGIVTSALGRAALNSAGFGPP